MKTTLLTVMSVALLSYSMPAQTSGGIQPSHGLQINTNGLKPRSNTPAKSSSGAVHAQPGGMPTGTNSPSGAATTASGGKAGSMGGSPTTTSTPASGGGKAGSMGGGAGSTGSTNTSGGNVSSSDAYAAVRQLLITGLNAAVTKVSATDGYYGNPDIKIPLPAEIQQVGSMLTTYGAGALVDKLVLQLNRSAEQSASLATPIFVNSLTQITPGDAVNIISGQQQNAATLFLQRTCTEQLVTAFKPQVKSILDQTKTSEIYADVMSLYNKIPFVSHLSADLPDYVTRQALTGLFLMVGREEARIRANPAAAGSSILSRVLGSVLGQNSLAAKRR